LKYLSSINLNQNEIQNARIQNLASAPSTPVEGQIYHDTTAHRTKIWNGSAWVDITSSASGNITSISVSSPITSTGGSSPSLGHDNTDGNMHVPATSTTNNGKFLKAGATAGVFAWNSLDWSDIKTGVPTTFTPPIATTTVLGGVKQGNNITIDASGVISATASPYTLPTASSSVLGGIKVGTNLSIDGNGVLSGNSNPSSLVIKEDQFTSTIGQTVFNLTGGYTVGTGAVELFVNGSKQPKTSYVETNASTITLTSGLSAGTDVIVRYINIVNVAQGASTISPSNTAISGTNYGSNNFTFQRSYWNVSSAVTGSSVLNIDNTGKLQWINESASVTASITQAGDITGRTLTSTVASGTAPFTVTSTTKVTNLNADLLDGYGADTANTASTIPVRDASGYLTSPTITATDNSTKLATTAFVQSNLTGGVSTIATTNLTASRALTSDASGKVAVSAVTSTELGYVSGVSSSIQTQLGGKEPSITAGTTGQYWRGDKSWQTLNSTAVGLGNVTNESKATMFSSPTFTGTASFTGTVTAVTPNQTVNDGTVATTAFVKTYADSVASGLDVKKSVRVATTGALAVSSSTSTTLTLSSALTAIDGITLVTNDRILVKDQTGVNAPQNGIYTYTNSTTLTRGVASDSSSELNAGAFTFVEEGATWADTGWVCSTDGTIVVGTTNITWTQFSSAGIVTGDGTTITKSGNTLSLKSAFVTAVGTPAFAKLSYDQYGRVSGTGAVASADITGALGYTPLNKGTADTMGGKLTISSGGLQVTGGTTTDTLTVSGATTATGAVTLNGGGTIATATTLTNSGTISGGTISPSTLSVSGTSTLTGAVSINGGGTIATATTLTNSGTISGGTVSPATLNVSGTSTLTGALNMNGGGTIASGQTLTNSGTISGGTYAGTITVSGNMTHSGTTALNGAVTIGSGVTLTNSGTITGGTINATTVPWTGISTNPFKGKFSASIGDGVLTSVPVTHNLGTTDVHVQLYEISSGLAVMTDYTMTNTNVVTFTFASPPTANQYKAVIIG
jgi:hypothetical protein